ncbi:hypothetical protein VPHD479_0305 [Vibrio phage D479]
MHIPTVFEQVAMIGKQAEELLERYIDKVLVDTPESKRKSLKEHLHFVGVQDDFVIFGGEEYWAYGGYERYDLDMPKEYLFSEVHRLDMERKAAEFVAKRVENEKARVALTEALNSQAEQDELIKLVEKHPHLAKTLVERG